MVGLSSVAADSALAPTAPMSDFAGGTLADEFLLDFDEEARDDDEQPVEEGELSHSGFLVVR